MTDIVMVLTTVPDDERAEALARRLVDERLAACVNVLAPMVSTYRWKGSVERGTERQIVIKTTRGRLPVLQARFSDWHPYELPEFLVVPIEAGSPAYLAWVAEETQV